MTLLSTTMKSSNPSLHFFGFDFIALRRRTFRATFRFAAGVVTLRGDGQDSTHMVSGGININIGHWVTKNTSLQYGSQFSDAKFSGPPDNTNQTNVLPTKSCDKIRFLHQSRCRELDLCLGTLMNQLLSILCAIRICQNLSEDLGVPVIPSRSRTFPQYVDLAQLLWLHPGCG